MALSAGRITVASFGAALSTDTAATIEYGMFDASDGYFLRVVGTSLLWSAGPAVVSAPQTT